MNEELAAYQNAIALAKNQLADLRTDLVSVRAARDQARRQLSVLADAARPAATILFNLAQQPALDERTRETIQQTLAPLDAALAATKGGGDGL